MKYFLPLLVIAVLAAACGRHHARDLEREPRCPVPTVAGTAESDPLRIRRCVPTGRVRLSGISKVGSPRCTMEPGEVTGAWREELPLAPRILLHGPATADSGVEIRIEPMVKLEKPGGGSEPILACDAEAGRFYVADAFLGYVVAFDRSGRELWRSTVPGFRSIVEELTAAQPTTAQEVVSMLQDGGSILAKLVVSGSYVAAEYRTSDVYHHAIYHRSGSLVGTVGPWNAVIREAVEGGWRLAHADSDEPGAYDYPDREVTLEVADARIDTFGEHLLASVTPRPRDGGYEWSLCPGNAADLGELLGERWKPTFANAALRIRNELGQPWLVAVADRIAKGPNGSLERALLSAGVDVEMMRFATERQLRPWDRSPQSSGSPSP